jgi:hypothetical protein
MNTNHTPSNMMQLVAGVERSEGDDKKSFWTRVGVAVENKDGSWNLRFDYLPARMGETTIQMRKIEPRPESDAAEPEPAREAAKPRAADSRGRR